MAQTDLSDLPSSVVEKPKSRPSDDDVNLLELWRILIRRKGVVLTVLLVSLVVAGLSIFLASPVYESRAVLQVGQVGQIGQVENSAVLTKRIMMRDDMDQGKAATAKERPFIHSAFLEKETNLVSIIARGPAPEAAQEYLAQVVAKVMHEHQELFDLARKKQQQSLDLMQTRSQGLNQTQPGSQSNDRHEREGDSHSGPAAPWRQFSCSLGNLYSCFGKVATAGATHTA